MTKSYAIYHHNNSEESSQEDSSLLFYDTERFILLFKILVFSVILMVSSTISYSQKVLLDLSGDWKFKIGDKIEWAQENWEDRDWKTVKVPGAWEDQGFPGYDGYGWYRTSFTTDNNWSQMSLFLELGRIDDVDEVYLNGELLGSTGSFPPNYETAYQHNRKYYIPFYKLNISGSNTIAVRVYDDRLMGGILEGRIALTGKNELPPDIDLTGFWNFKTGDDLSWSSPSTKTDDWTQLLVPKPWDEQGFTHYDGFAWYSLRFEFSGFDVNQNLVLAVGKIDDVDQVWLNGVQIGQTGILPSENVRYYSDKDHLKHRFYSIPEDLLKSDSENYIAVRVFDGEFTGGIYQGPIGIYTQERAALYEEENTDFSAWELFKNFMGW